MRNKYPKTVTACRGLEISLWEIGEALLDEVGPPNGENDRDLLAEVVEELADVGLDMGIFTIDYLGKIRNTTFNFPPSKRRAKISFTVHRLARTPEILETLREAAGDRPLTRPFVQAVLARQREKANREYEAKMEAHRAEADAARKRLVAAEQQRQRARSQEQKEAAFRELKAARDQKRSVPQPPPRPKLDELPPEPPSKTDLMFAEIGITFKANQAVRLGEEALEAVNQRLDEFEITDTIINDFVDAALAAVNAWQAVANAARKFKSNKRGHITAVK